MVILVTGSSGFIGNSLIPRLKKIGYDIIGLDRKPGGGDEKGPIKCPNWAILVLDHRGDIKTPCCLGSAKSDDIQPQCQSCGMSNYSSLLSRGISL